MELHALDHRRRVLGVAEAHVLEPQVALGPVKFDLAVPAVLVGGEHVAQAGDGLTRRRIVPPHGDELLERADDPPGEHVGGDERADRKSLVDDGKRAHRGQEDGGEHGQHGAQIHVAVRTAAAVQGALDGLGVPVLPRRSQGIVERQRLGRGAAGDHLCDQRVAGKAGATLFGAGSAEDGSGAPGEQQEKRQDDNEKPCDG